MATILVVDDRAPNRAFLITLLGYHGHRLLEASDGAQALVIARAERPQLVITDILMPTMDGYELVRRLRADPALASTAVIFYTAHYHGPAAQKLARDCGVAYILYKPSEPDVVLRTVKQALESLPQLAPEPPSEFAQHHRQLLTDKLAEKASELRRTNERLAALIALSLQLASERDPRRLLESVCRAARELTGAKYALLAIGNKDEGNTNYFTTSGMDSETAAHLGKPVLRGGVVGAALGMRKPCRVTNSGGEPSAVGLPAEHPPVHSLLVAPIVSLSHSYGWIGLTDKLGADEFSDEDERLLGILGAQVGRIYENGSLYLELEATERRFRTVFEHSVVGIFAVNVEGRELSANPALARMLGYESADALDADTFSVRRDVYVEQGADRRFQELLLAQKVVENLETRWRRRDGGVIWVSLSARLLAGDTEDTISYIGMAEDITAHKQAEEELRRFRLALDNSGDMIVLIDRAMMRFVDVNQTACRLLGYTRWELLQMGPQDILPASREELERAYDELIADPSLTSGINSYYLCKDGSQLPFESTRRVLRSGDTWLLAVISRDIRERIAAERALRDSEARFRQTFELAGSGMAHVSLDRRFIRVNRKLCEMLGYAEDELVGCSVKDLSHPDDRNVTDEQVGLVRAGKLDSASFEKRYLHKNGSTVWVSLTVAFVRDTAGEPKYAISVLDDITERKATQVRIERLTRVHAMLSGINSAIVRIRDRQELFDEACRIAVQAGRFPMVWLGMVDRERQHITPVAWNDLAKNFLYVAQDHHSIKEGATSLRALAVKEKKFFVSNDVEHDHRIVLKKEHRGRGIRSMAILPLLVSGEAVGVFCLYAAEIGYFDDEEMKLLAELAGDIAFALDHIEKEEKLNYLAYYDELTGLANSTLFHERLEQFVISARSAQRRLTVFVLDLDRFKAINDTLGRQAGDQLLKQIADRLVSFSADSNRFARIAGDRFAIVNAEVQNEGDAARLTQQRLEQCFGPPYRIGDGELRVSARVGIAMFPNDGADAEALFRNAEAALKRAKSSGERYLFYTQQMTERTAESLSLENKLRQALEKDEFVLHYQPIVDVQTRNLVVLEALLRWQSPERGLVPPMQFIPLLEETGLILQVGAWALRRAVRDHHSWVEQGPQAPRIAVNVSPAQLRQRDFVDVVKEALRDAVNPTGIDLEITESLIMEDIQGNITKLESLRELGIRIAIDDFGTGYSSLAYLSKLPVEALKIDRAFIGAMLTEPDTMTVVQTIISLAHSLHVTVVAEGVELEEQAKVLRLLGCDQMQGYLISKPVPLEQLQGLLNVRQV